MSLYFCLKAFYEDELTNFDDLSPKQIAMKEHAGFIAHKNPPNFTLLIGENRFTLAEHHMSAYKTPEDSRELFHHTLEFSDENGQRYTVRVYYNHQMRIIEELVSELRKREPENPGDANNVLQIPDEQRNFITEFSLSCIQPIKSLLAAYKKSKQDCQKHYLQVLKGYFDAFWENNFEEAKRVIRDCMPLIDRLEIFHPSYASKQRKLLDWISAKLEQPQKEDTSLEEDTKREDQKVSYAEERVSITDTSNLRVETRVGAAEPSRPRTQRVDHQRSLESRISAFEERASDFIKQVDSLPEFIKSASDGLESISKKLLELHDSLVLIDTDSEILKECSLSTLSSLIQREHSLDLLMHEHLVRCCEQFDIAEANKFKRLIPELEPSLWCRPFVCITEHSPELVNLWIEAGVDCSSLKIGKHEVNAVHYLIQRHKFELDRGDQIATQAIERIIRIILNTYPHAQLDEINPSTGKSYLVELASPSHHLNEIYIDSLPMTERIKYQEGHRFLQTCLNLMGLESLQEPAALKEMLRLSDPKRKEAFEGLFQAIEEAGETIEEIKKEKREAAAFFKKIIRGVIETLEIVDPKLKKLFKEHKCEVCTHTKYLIQYTQLINALIPLIPYAIDTSKQRDVEKDECTLLSNQVEAIRKKIHVWMQENIQKIFIEKIEMIRTLNAKGNALDNKDLGLLDLLNLAELHELKLSKKNMLELILYKKEKLEGKGIDISEGIVDPEAQNCYKSICSSVRGKALTGGSAQEDLPRAHVPNRSNESRDLTPSP